MTTRFVVTKQIQYPDGEHCVEISTGDGDYCNPDALVGGNEEFSLALEAVEYAIKLAEEWQEEQNYEWSPKQVFIGRGYTMGMTMPFDCEELCEETYAEFRAWATKHDEALPKCDYCGEVINEKYTIYELGEDFCSERCAEKAWTSYEQGDLDSGIEQIVERLKELKTHPLWQTQEYLYLILEDDDTVSVTDTSVHTAGTDWACWDEGDSLEDVANNLLGI